MDIATKSQVSRDWLTTRLQDLIEEDCKIEPAENLVLYGLDSIAVMTFSAELKRLGIEIAFEELAREPTLDHWWGLIASRL